jgi:hypothetical protein
MLSTWRYKRAVSTVWVAIMLFLDVLSVILYLKNMFSDWLLMCYSWETALNVGLGVSFDNTWVRTVSSLAQLLQLQASRCSSDPELNGSSLLVHCPWLTIQQRFMLVWCWLYENRKILQHASIISAFSVLLLCYPEETRCITAFPKQSSPATWRRGTFPHTFGTTWPLHSEIIHGFTLILSRHNIFLSDPFQFIERYSKPSSYE